MAGELARLPSRLRRRLYLPAYTTVEAARFAETTPTTVSRWFYGYTISGQRRGRVFRDTKKRRAPLSYLQLAEVAFVASFRKYGVPLRRIRQARDYLSQVFQVEYPFALLELKTEGVHVLKDLEEMGNGGRPKLIVADERGQEAWPEVLAERFAQFHYDYDIAIRWFPRGKDTPIAVDPRISFGAPIVLSAGVATWVLKERFEAGETPEELVDDFGIATDELRLALEFEGVDALAI